MPTPVPKEWQEFRVGKLPAAGFSKKCQPFATVSHVSHVTSAIQIVENHSIRPNLVFDESILNDRRILVAWLSPNSWYEGYRYGNVGFEYSFGQLVKDKRYYWIEVIRRYKPPACRILITDQDRDDELPSYDPTNRSGPWWYDVATKKHYFNNEFCLEFMFERTLWLSDLSGLQFRDHHPRWCSMHRTNPKKCRQLGYRETLGAADFVALAITADAPISDYNEYFIANDRPVSAIHGAFHEFAGRIGRSTVFEGSGTADSAEAAVVARSLATAYAYHRFKECKQLASFYFKDQDQFEYACALVWGSALGLDDWSTLL